LKNVFIALKVSRNLHYQNIRNMNISSHEILFTRKYFDFETRRSSKKLSIKI